MKCVIFVGHYSDIHSILRGQVGGIRAAQSFIDNNGHYSEIRSIAIGRDSGLYNYIDVDGENAGSGGDGDRLAVSGDQAVRQRGYEELDSSALDTLRQPERPHDYSRLGTGDNAASAQQTTEEIEMTAFDAGNYHQNTASRQLRAMSLSL